MNLLTSIILFVLMLLVIFVAYALCKKFIFGKVRINKWIPLAIAAVLFAAQIFVGASNTYISSGLSIFAVLFFLWFMDITQRGGLKKKEKQIVIKPKAKPNRVKKNK
ncbi:hypothetical protein [Clostridium beijerinckii]|uniref:hypothetical protein n=1 Tax=Clostridium beijerinckii TaxID=1520 RepID=UPI0004793361|nr:hypothetical protein [Clostridium beijerinckii]